MDVIDIQSAMRNVLQILQTDPANYKKFGIYWWPVKALLKQYYDQNNLYLLGDYEDPDTAVRVPDVGLKEILKLCFQEYQHNASYGRGSGRVEDPDGEIVIIFDEDAGQ